MTVNFVVIKICMWPSNPGKIDSKLVFTFEKRWFQHREVQSFQQETLESIFLRKK